MARFQRLVHRLHAIWWALCKPLTIGVRVLLVSGGRAVLVRHTYQDHWYLPGGGVKRNETLDDAVRREATEEVGAEIGPIMLFGVYSSFFEHKSDHVVDFLCREFELRAVNSAEIASVDLFPLERLPDQVSPGTRRRIGEYLDGAAPRVDVW